MTRRMEKRLTAFRNELVKEKAAVQADIKANEGTPLVVNYFSTIELTLAHVIAALDKALGS